jgi:PAN domain
MLQTVRLAALNKRHRAATITCLAVGLMTFVLPPAHAAELTYEPNTDRPGCDFKNFPVPNSPNQGSVCGNACGRDPSCQAWNFDPVHFGGKSMCFLKNCHPSPQTSFGVTGGMKLPFTMGFREFNVDRPGCDIQNFQTPDITICENACGFAPNCESWNYDSRQGTPGTCFLKTASLNHRTPSTSLAA